MSDTQFTTYKNVHIVYRIDVTDNNSWAHNPLPYAVRSMNIVWLYLTRDFANRDCALFSSVQVQHV